MITTGRIDNPFMNAMAQGGQLANQTMTTASQFGANAIKAFDSGGSLAMKLDSLLQNAEAQRFDQMYKLSAQSIQQEQFAQSQQYNYAKLNEDVKYHNASLEETKNYHKIVGDYYEGSLQNARDKMLSDEKYHNALLGKQDRNMAFDFALKALSADEKSWYETFAKTPGNYITGTDGQQYLSPEAKVAIENRQGEFNNKLNTIGKKMGFGAFLPTPDEKSSGSSIVVPTPTNTTVAPSKQQQYDDYSGVNQTLPVPSASRPATGLESQYQTSYKNIGIDPSWINPEYATSHELYKAISSGSKPISSMIGAGITVPAKTDPSYGSFVSRLYFATNTKDKEYATKMIRDESNQELKGAFVSSFTNGKTLSEQRNIMIDFGVSTDLVDTAIKMDKTENKDIFGSKAAKLIDYIDHNGWFVKAVGQGAKIDREAMNESIGKATKNMFQKTGIDLTYADKPIQDLLNRSSLALSSATNDQKITYNLAKDFVDSHMLQSYVSSIGGKSFDQWSSENKDRIKDQYVDAGRGRDKIKQSLDENEIKTMYLKDVIKDDNTRYDLLSKFAIKEAKNYSDEMIAKGYSSNKVGRNAIAAVGLAAFLPVSDAHRDDNRIFGAINWLTGYEK